MSRRWMKVEVEDEDEEKEGRMKAFEVKIL